MPSRCGSGGLAMVALVLAATGCGSSSPSPSSPHRGSDAHSARARAARPVALHVVRSRSLPDAVQLPGLARVGSSVLAAAGLNAADSSVADVVRLAPGAPRRVGT